MWQELVTGIIVGLAAFIVARQVWRSLTGRRSCDVDQCASCPFGEGCGHIEKTDEESS